MEEQELSTKSSLSAKAALLFFGVFLMAASFGFNKSFTQRPPQNVTVEPPQVIVKEEGDKKETKILRFNTSDSFTSKSYLIYDNNSDQIVYGNDIGKRLPNASTTKLMTALVAFKNYSLDTILNVPQECVTLEGSNVGLQLGEKFYVEDLLYGLLLRSGSDASCVLSSSFPGGRQAFIQEMNSKADELELKDTQFKNEIGLDAEGHYSSSRDLLLLTKHILKIEKFKIIMGTRSYVMQSLEGKNYAINNTNELLFDLPGTVGYKTGYTGNAGECLVYGYENLGNKLIIVVMGSEDRFADVKELLNGYLQEL